MLKKMIAAGVLAGTMILSGALAFAGTVPDFTDVKEGDWFAENVHYVCEEGLMKGVSENRFDPSGTFTRGMMVTVLYRMEGEPAVEPGDARFEDVGSEDWYGDPVAWAASEKLVNGISETAFAPKDPVTREQLAAILYRYVQMEKQKAGLPADGERNASELRDELSGYCSDGRDVSEYALQPALWAVQNGILKGDNRKLMPKGNATRAQVAAVMSRFCQKQSNVPAEDGAYYSRDGKILYRIPTDYTGKFTVKEGTVELADRCAVNCTGLEALIVPEGVRTIGREAFAGCSALRTVRLPASMEALPDYAPGMVFKDCPALEELTIVEGNPRYDSENNVIIDQTRHQVVLAAPGIQGAYTVPEGVIWFGVGAFAGCKDLKELVLSDTVKDINYGSLIGCDSLESIHFGRDFYLPDPEPQIMATGQVRYFPVFGDEFRFCPNLKHITVSEENPHFIAAEDCLIDVDRGHLLVVPQGKAGSLTLPEGIEFVGRNAFYRCSRITEIRFPESMKNLSDPSVYEGCDGVETIYLPKGIEYFYGPLEACPNLKTIEFGGTEADWQKALASYWRNAEAFEKLSGVTVTFR